MDDQLTDAESEAVSVMLKDKFDAVSERVSEEDLPKTKLINKERKINRSGLCMCPYFIMGSAAEVNRLWNIARDVLIGFRGKAKQLLTMRPLYS